MEREDQKAVIYTSYFMGCTFYEVYLRLSGRKGPDGRDGDYMQYAQQ